MAAAMKSSATCASFAPKVVLPRAELGRTPSGARALPIPQRSSLLPYRGVLSFCSQALEALHSEAARVHQPARRRGTLLAYQRASATGHQNVSYRLVAARPTSRLMDKGISSGLAGLQLC